MFLAIFTLIDLALLHNAFQLLVNNSLAVGNDVKKYSGEVSIFADEMSGSIMEIEFEDKNMQK